MAIRAAAIQVGNSSPPSAPSRSTAADDHPDSSSFAESLRAAERKPTPAATPTTTEPARPGSPAKPAARKADAKGKPTQNDDPGEENGQEQADPEAVTTAAVAVPPLSSRAEDSDSIPPPAKVEDDAPPEQDPAAAAQLLAAQLATVQAAPVPSPSPKHGGGGKPAPVVQSSNSTSALIEKMKQTTPSSRTEDTVAKQQQVAAKTVKQPATAEAAAGPTAQATAEATPEPADQPAAPAPKLQKPKATAAIKGHESTSTQQPDDTAAQPASFSPAQADAVLNAMVQQAAPHNSQRDNADARSDSDGSTPPPQAAPRVADDSAQSAKLATKAQEVTRTNDHGSGDGTFDQIVLGLRSKFDPRSGKAEISLQPPNLGKVHVSISLESGTLTAQFRVESQPVRDLLNSRLDQLKSSLESQGVAVDRLAVNASTETTGGNTQQDSSLAGSPNDGRSAGQYSQSGGRRQEDPKQPAADDFRKLWRTAAASVKPIDLVG